MKLNTVTITNYKSIHDISFEIIQIGDKSFTYGLIGVNEVGKSSILKALALKDNPSLLSQRDFQNKKEPVIVKYLYELDKADFDEYDEILKQQETPIEVKYIDLKKIVLLVTFEISNPTTPIYSLEINGIPKEILDSIWQIIKTRVIEKVHTAIFWTADPKYLISQPINLTEFANSPESVSIPLKNCFHLTGISDIKSHIDGLFGDSTEIEQLQTQLGKAVTNHINSTWKGHPIEITFIINDGFINFHIKDDEVDGKAKTAEQRSDGFKQFISFLLTISAQNINDELSNSILLLDEPETHLHPKAQECLLEELKNISNKNKNNIVFFATHSNYMVDKDNLDRNYRISKIGGHTQKDRLDKTNSTYSSVNYEVFEIPNNDYHNELYSKLHEKFQEDNPGDSTRACIKTFDSGFLRVKGLSTKYPWKGTPNQVTLPTFVRNCIHHPDGGDKFSLSDLKKSIDLLKSYD